MWSDKVIKPQINGIGANGIVLGLCGNCISSIILKLSHWSYYKN